MSKNFQKILAFALFGFCVLVSAQNATLEINVGSDDLNKKLSNNIIPVLQEYNFNGKMTVEYSISSEGKVKDIQTYPLVDSKDFNTELKRAIVRSNKFSDKKATVISTTKNITFPLEFYTTSIDKPGLGQNTKYGAKR